MLRALEGDEAAVTHSIQLMLECAGEEEPKEGLVLENASVDKIVDMIQDSSSSHLMEVSVLLHEIMELIVCHLFI